MILLLDVLEVIDVTRWASRTEHSALSKQFNPTYSDINDLTNRGMVILGLIEVGSRQISRHLDSQGTFLGPFTEDSKVTQ